MREYCPRLPTWLQKVPAMAPVARRRRGIVSLRAIATMDPSGKFCRNLAPKKTANDSDLAFCCGFH